MLGNSYSLSLHLALKWMSFFCSATTLPSASRIRTPTGILAALCPLATFCWLMISALIFTSLLPCVRIKSGWRGKNRFLLVTMRLTSR
ncbi:Uncharacterised protein [Segatella copri]|nr:Uncharacterised protein [Segatella copri]